MSDLVDLPTSTPPPLESSRDEAGPVIEGSAATVFVDYLAESEHRDVDPIRPVNVAAVLAGGIEHPAPSLLVRSDGAGILYPAAVHSFVGPAESGKSWLALRAAAELLTDSQPVVMFDYETSPATVLDRLLGLGVPPDLLATGLVYLNPEHGFEDDQWHALHAATAATAAALVIVDGVSEAFATHGWDVNSATDAAKFSRTLRPFAAAGAAVVAIDHVSKGGDGRTALGSQHKRAGVDVELWLEAIDTPHPRKPWRIRVGLSKDRNGALYEHVVGEDRVLLTATVVSDDVGTAVTLEPPTASAATGTKPSGWRPDYLMKRVSDVVESAGGEPVPVDYVLDEVHAKDPKWVHVAIEELCADGTVVMDHGDLRWPAEAIPDAY